MSHMNKRKFFHNGNKKGEIKEKINFKKLEELNEINKKKKSLSLEFKIAVVSFINQYKHEDKKLLATIRKKIREKFKVDKSQLSKWEKNLNIIKEEKNLNAKRIAGAGRKSQINEYEKEIILWIMHTRKAGFPVTTKTIIAFILSIDKLKDEFQFATDNSLRQVVKRFLIKNHLSIRKASRIGMPLPLNAKELIK